VCDCDVSVVHCSIVHVESDKAIFLWILLVLFSVRTGGNEV